MSTTYCLRFDTGNAAFEDYGRDAEVSAVIRRAADRIERAGLEDGFNLFDTNGNRIGQFCETTPPAQGGSEGEVELSIETGNAAFEGDPAAEVVRILRYAAQRIGQSDWPAGLLDINGNHVGSVSYHPAKIAVPEDVEWRSGTWLETQHRAGVKFYTNREAIDEAIAETGLDGFGGRWVGVAVYRDEDDAIEELWVAEEGDSEKFAQVMERYAVLAWAEAHDDNLKYGP